MQIVEYEYFFKNKILFVNIFLWPFFFFKVVLEGVVGPNFLSDIGVDDVIVKDCSLGPGDRSEKTGGQIQVFPNKIPFNGIHGIQSPIKQSPLYRFPYHPGLQIKTLHPFFQKFNIYPKSH